MSLPSRPLSGGVLHRLVVEADADPNVLLRLLEPFVIHDVLPHAIHSAHLEGESGPVLSVELEFSAEPDLAARLEARLAAMVPVRDVALDHVRGTDRVSAARRSAA